MEVLYILREWVWGDTYTKTFTLDELETMREMLSMDSETFTEFITGLNCDSYADESCDIMEELYRDLSYTDEDAYKLENCYTRAMETEAFQTCYTVYRLWNTQLTRREARESWKESCLATLEGIVEDKGLNEV